MSIRSKRIIYFLAIVMLLAGCVVWGIGSLLTRSTNSDVPVPRPPAYVVQIDSTSGIRLSGTYWPTSQANAPSVMLLHGNGSNRGSMSELGSWLNRHGYAVLAVDLRGHGQSSSAGKSFGLYEAEDAMAAFEWLRSNTPHGRIGVVGFSLGGAASLIGRKGPLPVDAFVLEGVYPDIRHAIFNRLALRLGKWPATVVEPLLSYQSLPRFGVWPSSLSPVRALAKVDRPVMIVGGSEDTNTPPAETKAMYQAVRSDGEMHILAGISHNDLGRVLPEDFEPALLAFLDENLRGASGRK